MRKEYPRMKTLVTAIAAVGLLVGISAAQAQSNSNDAGTKADTSANMNNSNNSDSSMKADSAMKSERSATRHKHVAQRHHRYHRQTTGIGSENNARARGSQLPGKDKLNSKAYIQEH